MTASQMFQDFLSNLKVDNQEQITSRYQEITKALNQEFRTIYRLASFYLNEKTDSSD